ncbi:MAG: hypothetical protein HeimC3_38800 [Candidatus Heimdallarchaeota archaeon LC_3]|nr:MAG: hypothetical protein HeimC3_38800 [Candidatus Heimdallarchaeota archaeon LC_3]
MADLTFSIIDPNQGPLVAFTTSEESFAKKIAVKAQLSVSMSKTDFNIQDAVLPFPDLGKIGFIFLFKVYGRQVPVIASITYVVDQDQQMNLYKQIPVLKRRAHLFAYRLSNYVYDGKPTLSGSNTLLLQKLFKEPSDYRSDLLKQAVRTKMQKSNISWLLKTIKKDLDQAITALLLEQPVLIIGHRVLIEQMMGTLELFLPWKTMIKLMETTTPIDPTGFDLVGCQDVKFTDFFLNIGVTVINIEKGKVEGGIPNKSLQTIIEKVIRPKDSSSAERYIISKFNIYKKMIDQIVEYSSKVPVNIDKIIEDLSNLDEENKSFILSMAKIQFPSFQSIFNQL